MISVIFYEFMMNLIFLLPGDRHAFLCTFTVGNTSVVALTLLNITAFIKYEKNRKTAKFP